MVLDPKSSGSSSESARTRANRENARKSTGPKTDEGKKRSSRNAVKHGIFCPGTILPGESAQAYQGIVASHYVSFNPTTLMELSLVEQIADAQWRLTRLHRAEAEFIALQMENVCEGEQKKLDRLKQRHPDIDFSNRENCTDEEDHRVFNRVEILTELLEFPVPASAGLLHAVFNNDKALALMGRYEQRLQQTITRSLRQLKELRTAKAFEKSDDLSPLVKSLLPNDRSAVDPDVFDDDVENDATERGEGQPPNDDSDPSESDQMPENVRSVDEDVDRSKNEPMPEGERNPHRGVEPGDDPVPDPDDRP